MSDHLRQLEELLRAVWIDEHPERMTEFFNPATGVQGLIPHLLLPPSESIEFVRAMMAHVQCNAVEVLNAVEQNDWLATTVQFQSVRRDTGAPIDTISMIMTRRQDGRFVECYNTFDFMAFFEALDLVPTNALALCLSGQQLK